MKRYPFFFILSIILIMPLIVLSVPESDYVAQAQTANPTSAETDSFAIPLAVGWNQISIPLKPIESDISQVLASIAGSYELVYAYDGCNLNPWQKYDPNVPLFANSLHHLDHTRGLWIKMRVADTLVVNGSEPKQTLIGLCQGWNLVGHPAQDGRIVEALKSIDRAAPLVYAYNAHDSGSDSPWTRFDSNVPTFANTLVEMKAGFGYWIEVNQDIELLINPTASPPKGVIGVQVNKTLASTVAPKASEANLSWVRYNGVIWSEIEAEQDKRDWEALRLLERNLQTLIAQGLTPMVIVRGTPKWAQKEAGAFCGPIKEEALDDFADFMHQLVTRYSQPPFNIKYWELGNEPDIDPSLIAPTEPFGCWGDQDDEYYGGGYYAKMLKEVYPAIKAADPDAQVILGGLVLDCDPTTPPEGKDNQDNKDCHSSKFFEGILRNGGGDAFDMVAYHAYPYWHPTIVDSDLTHANWQHRGGVLLGKADFIREVMARYDVDKPIIMNEGALLCHPSNQSNQICPNDAFYQAQANYLPRLYARAWANDLQAAIWYTLNGPGWRHAGLLDEAQAPRPAYDALSFMGQLLAQATYKEQLSEGALEGYAFSDEKGDYQLYWSNDGLSHVVRLPAGTTAVYNRFGELLPFDEMMLVGVEPIYIELRFH